MNWLDVFCFTSVARTNSFSITARELMISQQAVSRHIRTLESELGFQLFLRNYQSVQLTKAGELMLQYFNERDQMMDGLYKELRAESDNNCLRIGWTQWIGCPDWFRRTIEEYAAAHPEVQILAYDLTAQELQHALELGEMDVLLTTRYACSYMPVAWQVTVLSEEPVYMLGSAHVDYKMDMLEFYPHLAAFAGEAEESGVHLRVRKDYVKLGVQPRHIEVFPDMGAVCLNILLKGGVSLGVGTSTIRDNPDFVLMETGQSASLVLCRQHHVKKECVEDFCRFAQKQEVRRL